MGRPRISVENIEADVISVGRLLCQGHGRKVGLRAFGGLIVGWVGRLMGITLIREGDEDRHSDNDDAYQRAKYGEHELIPGIFLVTHVITPF